MIIVWSWRVVRRYFRRGTLLFELGYSVHKDRSRITMRKSLIHFGEILFSGGKCPITRRSLVHGLTKLSIELPLRSPSSTDSLLITLDKERYRRKLLESFKCRAKSVSDQPSNRRIKRRTQTRMLELSIRPSSHKDIFKLEMSHAVFGEAREKWPIAMARPLEICVGIRQKLSFCEANRRETSS